MGVDIKSSTVDQQQQSQNSELLILFGGNCCLVIKLDNNLMINCPSSILNLLADNNICVSGSSNSMKPSRSNVSGSIYVSRSIYLSGGVEVGQLFARVLKNPNLSKCGLEELDKEVRNTTAVAAASPDQTVCPLQDL